MNIYKSNWDIYTHTYTVYIEYNICFVYNSMQKSCILNEFNYMGMFKCITSYIRSM